MQQQTKEHVETVSNGGVGGRRSRHVLLALLIIVLCGAGLRLAYFQEIAAQPEFQHPLYDPEYNDYWARGLATGDWTLPSGVNDPEIRSTPHGRPPGYPYFLAAVYFLFGTDYRIPRLVQMGLGLVNIVLLFLLGRRLFGPATGLVAAAFMAVYWSFPYFEGLLTYPSVVVFLLLCLMLALCRWAARPSLAWALGIGLLLGAFGLFRPNGLLFGPVLVLWALWVLMRKKRLRRWPLHAAAMTLGTLILLAPPMLRDYFVAKDVVFISSYGGLNLYVGNNPGADGVEPRIPELRELAGIDNWCCFDYPAVVRGLGRKLEQPNLSFSDANRYFYGKAWEYIRSHPGETVWKTLYKALLFWGPREITNDTVMAYDKQYSRVLGYLPGFPVVLALFLLGLTALMLGRRARVSDTAALDPASITVMLLFILSYFLSVIPFFVAGRYRVPLIPFLLLIGAYGVVQVVRLLAAGKYRAAGALEVLAVAFFALASWNITGYEPSAGVWHFRHAMACAEAGAADDAIAEYRKAIELEPDVAASYANLGLLLNAQGHFDEAVAVYEAGLKIAPGDSALQNNLGVSLESLGREEDAEAQYRAALESDPGFERAIGNLGNLLLRQGRATETRNLLQPYLADAPEDAGAQYNFGRAWFALGDLEKAVAAYRLAVQARPEFADAWNNLGYTLARMGKLDEALPAYEQALAANPAYTLARNNLGNALLELGRVEDAIATYRAALETAPEDVYARHNLGRAYEQAGQMPEAEQAYRNALAADPKFADAQNNLGYLLARQSRFEEAIEHYQAAIASNPDFVLAHLNLGVVFEVLGRLEEAKREYQRVLALSPGHAAGQERLNAVIGKLRHETGE